MFFIRSLRMGRLGRIIYIDTNPILFYQGGIHEIEFEITPSRAQPLWCQHGDNYF
ncbi:hypothetical protein J31TS6_24930 [Brevibacillus reuszeri]|nr:hypothetical protein J31TS6_24930 [Brevibacillus reuszeri]